MVQHCVADRSHAVLLPYPSVPEQDTTITDIVLKGELGIVFCTAR
jgi:hypothetical protein